MRHVPHSSDVPATIVLVFPGGKPRSMRRSHAWHLSVLRAAWLARALRQNLSGAQVAVHLVRYRYRGWNGARADPLIDGRAALHRVRTYAGGADVVLVGHSMGGRVAVHLAGEPMVRAVIGLAPWWPDDDSDSVPGHCRLAVVHGTHDTWTDPCSSQAQVQRLSRRGICATWLPVTGGGHFMLTRANRWHALTTNLVRRLAATTPSNAGVADDL